MPVLPAPAAFSRADLARAQRELMRDGRWANARVERVTLDGVQWTLKDFSGRSPLVRNTLGRFLLRRELRALQRLAGIHGVPGEAFRVDGHAIAARYLPGTILAKLPGERIGPQFLEALEALLARIHERGIVHMDTRGASNMLMLPDGSPGLFDFQAALSTHWMPAAMRRVFESVDLSGVYKKWAQWQPQAMGAERREKFEHANRWRRAWVLRGYFGMKKRHRPGSHGPGS